MPPHCCASHCCKQPVQAIDILLLATIMKEHGVLVRSLKGLKTCGVFSVGTKVDMETRNPKLKTRVSVFDGSSGSAVGGINNERESSRQSRITSGLLSQHVPTFQATCSMLQEGYDACSFEGQDIWASMEAECEAGFRSGFDVGCHVMFKWLPQAHIRDISRAVQCP